jgi:hypothetical protein
MLQIFSAVIIVCGAVTLSRLRDRKNHGLCKNSDEDDTLLRCSALLLAICGVTLLLEIMLLTVSFILNNKIFAIVVSYQDSDFLVAQTCMLVCSGCI